MADLPTPTSEAATNIIVVRRFMPARISDVFPAVNQPGQDSVPGTDSTD
jgi:hypothetical protein